MKIVNPSSFIADDLQTEQLSISGTVEATVNGKTRRVRASRSSYMKGEEVIAYGIAGKYATGTKVWPCYVIHTIGTGREGFGGGFENRSTRSVIRSIVGFMADVAEKHHSQR